MSTVHTLQYLRDAVAARFVKDNTQCPAFFGPREAYSQLDSGRRIVWIPGDPRGSIGRVGPPVKVGTTPTRDLFEIRELATVYLTASDSSAFDDDEAQFCEVRTLFDAFLRALHHAAPGRVKVLSAQHLYSQGERMYGATIQAVLEFSSRVPDIPLGAPEYQTLANPTGEIIAAEITVRKLDLEHVQKVYEP